MLKWSSLFLVLLVTPASADQSEWGIQKRARCIQEAVNLFGEAVRKEPEAVGKYICSKYTYKFPCKIQKFMVDKEIDDLFRACMGRSEA